MKTACALLLALCGLTPLAQAQAAKGNADAGAKINSMCIGCHGIPGYQSSFPEVHKVPMISGQNAQYIAAALEAYRKGDRKNATMRGIAGSLTDQQIADLAAYYAQHAKLPEAPQAPAVQPSAEVAALLAKGACVSCHGPNFTKPIDGNYPKIAGQYPDYLYVALKAYKTEGSPVVGRSNPVMAAQVKQFSLQELKALAQYIGSLQPEMATIAQAKFR